MACTFYQNVFDQLRLAGVLQLDRLGSQKEHSVVCMKNCRGLDVSWYRVIRDANAIDLHAKLNSDSLAVQVARDAESSPAAEAMAD